MLLNVIIKVLALCLLKFSSARSELAPIVGAELSPTGFHRNLEYTVSFDYPLAGKECEYYLEQKFPAAVYVDVDQLNGLRRLRKLTAIYPSFVDVEIPTEKAEPFSVLLYGIPKITDKISLPIHFRYHSPGTKSFVKVELDEPVMYLRCPEENLHNLGLNTTTINRNFCIVGTRFEPSTKPNCDWKQIETHVHLKTPLRAQIPIGDSKLRTPIMCITVAISWIGCFCVLFALQNKRESLNKKLK